MQHHELSSRLTNPDWLHLLHPPLPCHLFIAEVLLIHLLIDFLQWNVLALLQQKCLSEVRGPLVDLGVSEYGILSAIATLSDTQNDLGLNHQQPSSCPEPSYSVDDITLFRQIALDLRELKQWSEVVVLVCACWMLLSVENVAATFKVIIFRLVFRTKLKSDFFFLSSK